MDGYLRLGCTKSKLSKIAIISHARGIPDRFMTDNEQYRILTVRLNCWLVLHRVDKSKHLTDLLKVLLSQVRNSLKARVPDYEFVI